MKTKKIASWFVVLLAGLVFLGLRWISPPPQPSFEEQCPLASYPPTAYDEYCQFIRVLENSPYVAAEFLEHAKQQDAELVEAARRGLARQR